MRADYKDLLTTNGESTFVKGIAKKNQHITTLLIYYRSNQQYNTQANLIQRLLATA